jgi:A/G-specific adenine glycosylase
LSKLFLLFIDLMEFKSILNKWYLKNRRDLPWRNSKDPYSIWVSEIILQQTRVAQGIGFYNLFMHTFPTVHSLANAHEDEVLKVWQGLGYYSRARNMHKAAKQIVEKFNGKIPDSFKELLKLSGVGHYSAGAIASFAFKEVVPAIDGNVYRVMSRIYGLFASPYTTKGKREFYELVMELIDRKAPHHFNQALLDFGALQCPPRNPKCFECPFSQYCYAFRNNLVQSLPIKSKKLIPKNRFFVYLLIRCKGLTYIHKRNERDIWQSLYQFPLIETEKLLEEQQIITHPEWKRIFGRSLPKITYISPVVKHQLSHQNLNARFVIVEINRITTFIKNSYLAIYTNSIYDYSVPRLIDNFLAAEPAIKYFLNSPL